MTEWGLCHFELLGLRPYGGVFGVMCCAVSSFVYTRPEIKIGFRDAIESVGGEHRTLSSGNGKVN